jgi:BlaI family transcriptional regulator, penicillinase repressor
MAPQSKPTLTPVQLEIMNLIWEHDELSVAEVRTLLGGRRPLARNTVQTMLTRLAERGWLLVRTEGKTFYFRAAQRRKSVVRRMMTQLIDSVFGGSASRLVMTLLENRQISADELGRIRERIDRAEQTEP